MKNKADTVLGGKEFPRLRTVLIIFSDSLSLYCFKKNLSCFHGAEFLEFLPNTVVPVFYLNRESRH